MKIIIISASIFFYCFTAKAHVLECNTPKQDLSKMIAGLKSLSLRKNQNLAKYNPVKEDVMGLKLTNEVIPPYISDLFFRLQDRVFGRQILKIETTSMINFAAPFHRNSVLINPNLWNKILLSKDMSDSKGTLRFIIAHELGHYVQDILSRNSSNDKFTMNGNLSFSDSSDSNYLENYAKSYLRKKGINTNNPDTIGLVLEQLFIESHVEVDTYGYLILKLAGGTAPPPEDLFRSFEVMIKLNNEKKKSSRIEEDAEYDTDEGFAFLAACEKELREKNLKNFFLSEKVDAILKKHSNFIIENKSIDKWN